MFMTDGERRDGKTQGRGKTTQDWKAHQMVMFFRTD